MGERDISLAIQGAGGFNDEIRVIGNLDIAQPEIAVQVKVKDEIIFLSQVNRQDVPDLSRIPGGVQIHRYFVVIRPLKGQGNTGPKKCGPNRPERGPINSC